MRGVFISFEGGEGVGKSTQARLLAEALQATGREVVLTREPGGTPGAEAVRGLLLNPASLFTPLADTFLHFAARADHVERILAPALARGAIVISDRFTDSTLAYQGYGMNVPLDQIRALSGMIGLAPDLTFILQAPPETAKQRLRLRPGAADRYERMDPRLMERVAQGFAAIAAREPERCQVIDASGEVDQVFQAILVTVRRRLDVT